jgi:hypothetical protein
MPEDHEILVELSEEIITFAIGLLTKIGGRIDVQLLELLTLHAQKLSSPPPVVFEAISKFRSFFELNFEHAVIMLNEFAEYLSVVIQKPNFSQLRDVLEICDLCLASGDLDLIPTVFVIGMILVQTHGKGELSVIHSLPFCFLAEASSPPVIAGAFCLLSCLLMRDCHPILNMVGIQRMELCKIAEVVGRCPLKYCRLGLIGFCILSRARVDDAFQCAEQLKNVLLSKSEKERMEDAEDVEDIDIECDGKFDEEVRLIDLEFPDDGIDAIRFFDETMDILQSPGEIWAECHYSSCVGNLLFE